MFPFLLVPALAAGAGFYSCCLLPPMQRTLAPDCCNFTCNLRIVVLSAVLICSLCLHLYLFLLLFPILALIAYYSFYLQTTLTSSVYSVAACNRVCFRHLFRWPALKLTSSAIYTSLRKRTLTQKLLRRINFVSEFYQYLRKQHILAWFLSFVFIKKPSMKSTISEFMLEQDVWGLDR